MVEGRPAHLWVGRSPESKECAELLFKENIYFVAIPCSGRAHPEFLFPFVDFPYSKQEHPELRLSVDRYRGIEEIKEHIKEIKEYMESYVKLSYSYG